MKNVAQILLILAILCVVAASINRLGYPMIFGLGHKGFLIFTQILLLFAANLTLLELLNKK